jgi:hypothetical protein
MESSAPMEGYRDHKNLSIKGGPSLKVGESKSYYSGAEGEGLSVI